MNTYLQKIFLLFAFHIGYTSQNYAQSNENIQAMGADLRFICKGESQGKSLYEAYVNIYYFCKTDFVPSSVELEIWQGDSLFFTYNLSTLDLDPSNPAEKGIEVTPIGGSSCIEKSTCHGGNLPGILKYTYSNKNFGSPDSTIRFLALAPNHNWKIVCNQLVRNESTNLVDANSRGFQIAATIDNINAPCTFEYQNQSPYFGAAPVPYTCSSLEFIYNQLIIDPDNDSLVITSINPLDRYGLPISYQDGYSVNSPILCTNPDDYQFDPQTGIIKVRPVTDLIQKAVFTIKIEEYDRITGVLKGSVMRDIEFVVENCENNQPIVNVSETQYLCPGSELNTSFLVTDTEGDSIQAKIWILNSDNSEIILFNDTTYLPNQTTIPISYSPPAELNQFTIQIEIKDDGCPFAAVNNQQLQVVVTDEVIVSPTTYNYCINSGDTLAINAQGCGTFTISPPPLFVRYNEFGKLDGIIPNFNITNYTISNGHNDVVINIAYKNPPTINSLASQMTVCKDESIALQNCFQTNCSDCDWKWSSSNANDAALSCLDCPNPTAIPIDDISYQLELSTPEGCTTDMQLAVTVENPPLIDFSGFNNYISSSTDFQLPIPCSSCDYTWSPDPTNMEITSNTTFSVVAQSPNGCTSTSNLTLHYDCTKLLIPTAFSPNDDGQNDEFKLSINNMSEIDLSDYKSIKLQIYNRWGEQLFETNNLNDYWDGTYKGMKMPIGNYLYHIQGACTNETSISKKGTITLLR